MIYSYIRISTNQQSVKVQREEIQRYCDFNHLTIDETIEVEISSRKDSRERKIDELLSKVKENDIVIVVGTQRIWPPRALTLGQLTHNDLASVRIAKRATKSL